LAGNNATSPNSPKPSGEWITPTAGTLNKLRGYIQTATTTPLTGNITTLPVKLLSFDAHKDESKVILNWITSSEINSDIFEIERQQNTEDFNKIGQVQAA
jgi:hypothetical protein